MHPHPTEAVFEHDGCTISVKGRSPELLAEGIRLFLGGPALPATRPTHRDGRLALRLLPTDEDTQVEQARAILDNPGQTPANKMDALKVLGYRVLPPGAPGVATWMASSGTGWRDEARTKELAWLACKRNEHESRPVFPARNFPQDPPAGPDLAAGLVDMIERGVLSELDVPDDWQWLRERLGPDRVDQARNRLLNPAEPDPFDDLARAAMALVEMVDECDLTEEFGGMFQFDGGAVAMARQRHSFVRLARGLETAVAAYREAQSDA